MKHKKSIFETIHFNHFNSILFLFFFYILSLPKGLASETLPGCYLYKPAKKIKYFKAENQKSFFTCLGYLHGSQHPYTMDLMRRKAFGRLSVLKGQSAYYSDFMMRMLNFEKLSKKLWEGLSQNTQTHMKRYTLGINIGLKEALGRKPSDYKSAPTPRTWHPRHSLALLLLYHFEYTKNQLPALLSGIKGENGAFIRNLFSGNSSLEGHYGTPKWIGFKAPLSIEFPIFKEFLGAQLKDSSLLGLSIPGIPLFFQGFNQKYSWSLLPKSSSKLQSIEFVPEDDLIIHQIYPLIKIKKGNFLSESQNKKYEVTNEGNPILPLETPKGQKALLKWRGLKIKAQHIEKFLTVQWQLSGFSNPNDLNGNFIKGFGEKVVKEAFAENFFDFIVSDFDSNNDSHHTISSHLREDFKEDFFISSSPYHKDHLERLRNSSGAWTFKDLEAFHCSVFPFPFPKNELLKKKEDFLKKVKIRRLNIPQKKAFSLLKNWKGHWEKDCKACTLFYVWYFQVKRDGTMKIQEGFSNTVLKFKKRLKLNVPAWATFKKVNSFIPKQKSFQSLLVVRNNDRNKIFLTSKRPQKNSCSLNEVPLSINWDKSDLRYRRFKNL